MDSINHRARKILSAVVSEYLATGEAVGSRTITRRGIDLSAATVRNVMSDLEEAGLLKQPHTSSGRVPTDQGLRFFVDSLLQVRALSPREREEFRSRYSFSTEDADQALREAGKVLSDLSSHTVVLLTPKPSQEVLEHLEFLRLASGALLAVLVTRGGRVENRLIHLESLPTPEEMERIHEVLKGGLNINGAGLTLGEVRARLTTELASERSAVDELRRRAVELGLQAVAPVKADAASQVIIEGHGRLLAQALEGEGDITSRMKGLLHALDEKQRLVALLEETEAAQGMKVFIGAETQLGDADVSVIAASYGTQEGERPLGTLGVIGPTRMNYSRVIALVDFTAQILSNLVRGQ